MILGSRFAALFAAALAAGQPAPDGSAVELDAMRTRLAQDRVKAQFLKREEASIIGGLQALDRSLADRHARQKVLADRIRKLEGSIATLDASLQLSEAELQALREKAGKRAAAMHRLRRTRLTELFREVSSPIRLRRLRDHLRLVLAHDAALVSGARRVSDTSKKLRSELTNERDALAESHAALAAEVEAAADLRAERSALLEAVRRERSAAQRLASELESAARRLERELGVVRGTTPAPDAAPGGIEAQLGRLPWPAAGRVEVPFGKKVDPASGMVMVQKGIDLRAPIAAPVRAVFDGSVAFAGWFEGFGRLVILEHAGGFHSLYAHLESIEVAAGQRVQQHQVVGLVGDSGSTKGAYLYFELRRGRDAVDPVRWLAP